MSINTIIPDEETKREIIAALAYQRGKILGRMQWHERHFRTTSASEKDISIYNKRKARVKRLDAIIANIEAITTKSE